MKARTYLFYLLPLTVLLLLILSSALAGVLGFDIDPLRLLGIVRKENSASSQILFERIQALQELHTVRYIYKTVFPFDYMDPQISFSGILSTLRGGKGSVNSLLSPKERDYLEAREQADAVGLRITGNRREFVVVTAQITAGIDLKSLKIEPLPGSTDSAGFRIIVPPPRITDVVIEDPTPENYPYPDIALTPERWKRIAAFTAVKVQERAKEGELLKSAWDQTVAFLSIFMRQAGITEIEFQEGSSNP
ncbi:MAG: DUF4230 domain-containing protein [Spirochaetales bacterium]|nr:DUF4230 domain-containing protein [Spirochaetales bacterium]